MENLSITLRNMGDNLNVKKNYLKILELKKKIYGENHLEYALALENLSIS